jgi:hypothetical protein
MSGDTEIRSIDLRDNVCDRERSDSIRGHACGATYGLLPLVVALLFVPTIVGLLPEAA